MNGSGSNVQVVSALHHSMVDRLVAGGQIRSSSVEAAFRTVPRHLFVPGVDLDTVYGDVAITTKRRDGQGISASSQPPPFST